MRPSLTKQANNPDYKQQAKQKILALIKFVQKNKKAIMIITAVVFVVVVLFNLIPTISIGSTTYVNIGASAKIKEGQTVQLKNGSVSVKILHFTNDVCPVPGKCFGSSMPAVEYSFNIEGKKYATGSLSRAVDAKYQIETVSSDYKTYADIRIIVDKSFQNRQNEN